MGGRESASLASAALALVAVALMALGLPTAGGLLLLVAALMLGVMAPEIGVLVILVVFPLQPLGVRVLERDFGVVGSSLILISAWKEALLGGMLLTLVWRGRQSKVRRLIASMQWIDWIAVAYVVLVAGTLLRDPSLAGVNQARLLLFAPAFFVVVRCGYGKTTRVLRAVTGISTLIAAFGIYQVIFLGLPWVEHYFGTAAVAVPATFTAVSLSGLRASGTLGSPNELAFQLASATIFAVVLPFVGRPRSKVIVTVAIAVLMVGIVLAASRSAIAATLIGLAATAGLLIAWSSSRRRLAMTLLAILVPAMLLAPTIYILRDGIAQIAGSIQTIAQLQPATEETAEPSPCSQSEGGCPSAAPAATEVPVDSSTAAHASSIADSFALMAANPLGLGLGRVGAHGLPGSAGASVIVESWYLSMGLAMGLPGFALAIATLVAMVAAGVSSWSGPGQPERAAAVGIAVMAAVVGVLLPTMLEPQLAILPWAAAGLAIRIAGSHTAHAAEPIATARPV